MVKHLLARKFIDCLSTISLVVLGTYLMPFLDLDGHKILPLLAGLVAMNLVLTFGFYRCPSCGRLLKLSFPAEPSCPDCGHNLKK
ncbi:MAG: hypothetical protein Q4E36_02215 [Bacillota bacterium]|nr:hypothetical protein [Bacillota bacterium]